MEVSGPILTQKLQGKSLAMGYGSQAKTLLCRAKGKDSGPEEGTQG